MILQGFLYPFKMTNMVCISLDENWSPQLHKNILIPQIKIVSPEVHYVFRKMPSKFVAFIGMIWSSELNLSLETYENKRVSDSEIIHYCCHSRHAEMFFEVF